MSFQLDEQHRKILKEIIRNPRSSDNQISRNTKVPVKTVNRKRKLLEEKGIINYFVDINKGITGTGTFKGYRIYITKFKFGITRNQFLSKINPLLDNATLRKHVFYAILGETNGQLVFIVGIESRVDSDIIEIFNAEIIPMLTQNLGPDCIESTQEINMWGALMIFHNYLPFHNMDRGRLAETWPDEKIFIN